MSCRTAATLSLLGGLVLTWALSVQPAKAGLYDPPPAYPATAYPAPTGPAGSSVPPGYPPTKYSGFPDPAYDWTGFYIGINGGLDWTKAAWFSDADITSGTSATVSSPFVGGTVGYNAQTIGSFVYGVEFDFDWRSPKAIVIPPASCAADCEFNRRWFATGLVRFGYAIDRFMPYVTGGIALSDQHIAIIGEPFGVHSELGVGLIGGGGIEIEVWRPLSVKVEYLFARYGHLTCNAACGVGAPFGTPSIMATPRENILRFGINYRL